MNLGTVLIVLAAVALSVDAGGCPHSGAQGSVMKTTVDTYRTSKKCPVSAAQRSSLQLALKEADRDGSLGAKVGLAYLKAHPESQKLFPSLAGVAPAELASHPVFVAKSAACMAALKPFFASNHYDKSKGCPYTTRTRGHYTTAQQLDFGRALVETVTAQLGDRITAEVKSALHATVYAVRSAAGQCPVDKKHRKSIGETLKAANQDGSLGPKTFAKYFKADAQAQKSFEAKGSATFNAKATTCMAAMTFYFNPAVFGSTNGCPFVESSKSYSPAVQRKFCLAMIEAVQDNGQQFNPDAVKAFSSAFAIVKARNH